MDMNIAGSVPVVIKSSPTQYRSAFARAADIRPMSIPRPKYRNQRFIEHSGYFHLSDGAALVVVHHVLDAASRQAYLEAATRVERRSGPGTFGQPTPRAEVCYTMPGASSGFNYSGVPRYSIETPAHMQQFALGLMEAMDAHLPEGVSNPYRTLSHGVDILYGNKAFARGGSVGKHKDREMPWKSVIILTLGQTRYLRVYKDAGTRATADVVNVAMTDNSLVCMLGPKFQRDYSHAVDKLAGSVPVGIRLSVNFRFL